MVKEISCQPKTNLKVPETHLTCVCLQVGLPHIASVTSFIHQILTSSNHSPRDSLLDKPKRVFQKRCERTPNVLTSIIADMPFFHKTKWRAFKTSSLYLNKYWRYSLSMTVSTAGRLLSTLSGYLIGRKSHRKITLIQPSLSFNVRGRRIH